MATAKQLAARKRFAAIMKSGGFPAKGAARKTARKKNPVKAAKRLPVKRAAPRRVNPAPALPAGTNPRRMMNPTPKPPSGFAVHLANAYGEPGKLLATFTTKPLAVEYAEGYANKHKKSVCIVGKK